MHTENKAGVRCTKRTLDAVRQNANLRDLYVLKYFNDISLYHCVEMSVFGVILVRIFLH